MRWPTQSLSVRPRYTKPPQTAIPLEFTPASGEIVADPATTGVTWRDAWPRQLN
jgi:hypothetical protein